MTPYRENVRPKEPKPRYPGFPGRPGDVPRWLAAIMAVVFGTVGVVAVVGAVAALVAAPLLGKLAVGWFVMLAAGGWNYHRIWWHWLQWRGR